MTEVYTQADLNRLATEVTYASDQKDYWLKKANDQGPGRGDAGHAWRFFKYVAVYTECLYLNGQLNEELEIAKSIRGNQRVVGNLMGDSISLTSPKNLLLIGVIGLAGFFVIKKLRK